MNKTTTWLTPGFDDAETPVAIELQQVDTLTYRSLTVPVWQITTGQDGCHAGPFVRRIDLPADLAEAFFDRWQYGANQPFVDAAYIRDFADFMARDYHPMAEDLVLIPSLNAIRYRGLKAGSEPTIASLISNLFQVDIMST